MSHEVAGAFARHLTVVERGDRLSLWREPPHPQTRKRRLTLAPYLRRLVGMRSTLALAVTLVVAVGCTNADPAVEPDAGVDAGVDAPPDLTGPLYDPARVIDVAIEIAPADWDLLRHQTRAIGDVFGSCPTGPHPNPFTSFHAAITVDGVTVADVGIRKKGFYGSLDEQKPGLKIKTDEYVATNRLFGLKSLTLNNAKQDPALIKQCLAYQVFAKAGVPASRCNFARVRVNGQDLGIYVNVEGVNKPMLRRHFTSDTGNLYEGALSDFRPTWTLTFDKKTNETTPSTDLDAVTAALAQPDSTLMAALDPLVDVEEFLDYWAAEILIGHTDSYSGLANNFLVYHDPTTGKFSFLPWGVDNTFNDGRVINANTAVAAANGMLARRLYLYPPTRDRYVARVRQHLATIWNETELVAEVDRMATLISAPADQVEAVRQFIRTRRAQLDAELAAGPPPWTAPFKPDAKPCFETNGSVIGTFQTTWGTLGASDVFASGTGTLTGTLDGQALAPQRVGAAAGADADTGHPTIQLFGENANSSYDIAVLSVEPALYVAGDHPAGFGAAVTAAVISFVPATNTFTNRGIVFEGTLNLTSAAKTVGGQVRGSFTLSTLALPF